MKRMLALAACGSLLLLAGGCGDGKKKKSLAERSGESLGRGAREFTVAVGKGVENARQKAIKAAPELQERGLEFTVSREKNVIGSNPPVLVLYVIAQKEFAGPLLLKALNAQGQEVGRTRQEIALEAEEAKYFEFAFPKEMDASTVESYEIRPGIAAAKTP